MRWLVRSAPVVLALATGSVAAAGEARVTMEQGLVSANLEAASVPEALAAVRRATGVEIVVPDSVRSKSLTLTAERMPFEQFVRRMLERLDLGGFALVYESSGAAQRVIVVERGRDRPPEVGTPAPVTEAVPAAGASAPPVYIPPATPPVYIPPATPPVYIPPARPPVYIPPATPPVYVPPATEPREPPPTQ